MQSDYSIPITLGALLILCPLSMGRINAPYSLLNRSFRYGKRLRPDPAELGCPIAAVNAHAIEEQQVKTDVEVIPGILHFTCSGLACGCSKTLPANPSAHYRIVGCRHAQGEQIYLIFSN
jgi:hypothetical protein